MIKVLESEVSTPGAGLANHSLFFTSKSTALIIGGGVKGFGFGDVWCTSCKVTISGPVPLDDDVKPAPAKIKADKLPGKKEGRATCVLVEPSKVKGVKTRLEEAGKVRALEHSQAAQILSYVTPVLPTVAFLTPSIHPLLRLATLVVAGQILPHQQVRV